MDHRMLVLVLLKMYEEKHRKSRWHWQKCHISDAHKHRVLRALLRYIRSMFSFPNTENPCIENVVSEYRWITVRRIAGLQLPLRLQC